ncbi:MAG: hypothetical protein H0X33_09715 [Taibaiella sp.]|nr:hypothetical protein [Taibaiella sp.]
MQADKNEWKVIRHALDEWEREGRLTSRQATDLRKSVTFRRADSQQLAQYLFIIALSCILLAFGAIFINDKLLEKLKSYFSLSNMVITGITALISVVWFWYIRRRRIHLHTIAYEIYMVLGGLAALTALLYVCKVAGFTTYTYFFSGAALVLLLLGTAFRSRALWIGSMLAFVTWYGDYTTLHSVQYLWLGMNYPVRFTVLGLLLLAFAALQLRIGFMNYTRSITYAFSMIVFFTALWGVSIFGNFNYLDEWQKVRQTHVLSYAILFGLAAGLSLFMGIRYKDETARDFGLLFLLINLYTRYFEYFWDTMNKGIFFLVLAVTFWFLGRWIEKNKKIKKPRFIKKNTTAHT